MWVEKLGKNTLTARQVSPRGGTLYCKANNGRVTLAGTAVLYSIAELML